MSRTPAPHDDGPAEARGGEATMIRTVIVDDEPPALDELAWLLSRFPDVEIAAKAETGDEAVELVTRLRPDLLFLDIEMPDMNGFQVLREIMVRGRPPLVVFATAFDEHAIRAFEQNSVDYLLKPISLERIGKTIERVRNLLAGSAELAERERLENLLARVGQAPEGGAGIVRVPVEDAGRNVLLSPDEILFFNLRDRRVLAQTEDAAYPCSPELSLDRLEERLAGFNFFRVNRAELINLKYVRSYAPWHSGKYIITMRHREAMEITLSKSRVRQFKAVLGI